LLIMLMKNGSEMSGYSMTDDPVSNFSNRVSRGRNAYDRTAAGVKHPLTSVR